MNSPLFVPLLAVHHEYFAGPLPQLRPLLWAGTADDLRSLAPRLSVVDGVVGLSVVRRVASGPTLHDLCAHLQELPIFGWEMIPASDFASYTVWPFRLSNEHPLLSLPFSTPSDPNRASASSVKFAAHPLRRAERYLVPVLPGAEAPSEALTRAWGETQARILARGQPSFSALTTGARLADLIELASTAPSSLPPAPQVRWSAPRARWAYHVSGYTRPFDLEVTSVESVPAAASPFEPLSTELPAGTRSFISREPQSFRFRSASPFRLRARGRDLVDALPGPPPSPLRLGPDEQPVADVFIHL